ncbi:MBL fold metallo-hydrolase [Massilia sp. Dwa41.01b]|uniref:MBL fold metallo-hydrolase n=1 Tax=unclassified Massilia TaxID=2609279 RepID=UPI0016012FD0|nr:MULTISPECIES: MBL fold metallo-hydrolase [unclassified Massilia]QNA87363.1 MBL fold metallo-hydrolase [Massilia sp. Dwa41.01b]QNA98270.1 MBL fold metallo-hydrolase [Massilia sp. Se16.2.3]
MNPLESQLAYPFGDELPTPGTVRMVAPGLGWLRMPLPFALDHINLWLLDDEREGRAGWSVVDTGVATDPTRAAWEQIFTGTMADKPVLRLFATHCHPDHVGLSGWLCERFAAPFWTTAGEFGFARMMAAALPGVDGPSAIPHFERHGLTDPLMLEQMRSRRNYYPSLVPSVPEAYTRLQDGQQLRIGQAGWRVITGFGHSPEHAALYSDALKVLISGDMVLPRISTNVSVFAVEPEGNPLQQYLDSLDKFAGLPEDTLVLPSHGRPFRGLHTRIAQLRQHHVARLAEVLEACRTPHSAVDIVPIMFRRQLDAHQLSFALGEALAHLHKLWNDGMLERVTGADGVLRFQLI